MKLFRKIFLPILGIVACTSIAIGTTYALFTSNDKANIPVSAGKVDVKATVKNNSLQYYSPTSIDADGTILDDTNAASSTHFFNGGTASISEGVLALSGITPGDKISFIIDIKNNSNVDIKYCIVYEDATEYTGSETHKLIDVLKVKNNNKQLYSNDTLVDWTKISGDTIDSLSISVELPSDTEIEYSGLSCNLRFKVDAVQGNAYTENKIKQVSLSNSNPQVSATSDKFNVNKNTTIKFIVTSVSSSLIEITVADTIKTHSIITYSFDVEGVYIKGYVNTIEIFNFNLNSYSGQYTTYVVDDDCVVEILAGKECCVLEGTPITMGDYSFKNVEDLMPGDQILAYDFFEGKFVSSEINYAFDEMGITDTFKIHLDNSTTISTANDEDMFDVNSGKYFTIDASTYKDAIGKEVLVNSNGSNVTAKISSIEHVRQFAHFYTLYSTKYINYVANNVLMCYSNSGFNEKYTVTKDLKIDMDIYNSDVEKYGLFTYEDFPELTKDMFDEFDLATVSFIIGKGYINREMVDIYNQAFIKEYNCKKPLFLSK